MIKRIIFCWTIVFLSIYSNAQEKIWTGTKTSYAPQQTKYARAPKNYHPFFVNHVGRHGSRYMTKPGSDSLLLQIFALAAKENQLSDLGKKWQKLNAWLTQQQKGKYSDITLQGAEEHKAIAQRLRNNYPGIFQQQGLDIWYTHKIRTLQSANGFLQAFSDDKHEPVHFFTQPESKETMLRFYDYSTAYDSFVHSKEILEKMDSITSDPILAQVYQNVATKFIGTQLWQKWMETPTFIGLKGKKIKITDQLFTDCLFDIYGVGLSTKVELKKAGIPISWWSSPFSNQEGQILGRANDVEDYLVKGPGLNHNGIQAKIAAPLLWHFLVTSDSVIAKTKKVDGIFRFTHAEAISPFATLLDIRRADSSVAGIKNFDKVWNAGTIIPMVANVQWIFYSNGKNILVKILLNEKEAHIPVISKRFPFYDWSEVRKYYYKKLQTLGIHDDISMLDYLKNIR